MLYCCSDAHICTHRLIAYFKILSLAGFVTSRIPVPLPHAYIYVSCYLISGGAGGFQTADGERINRSNRFPEDVFDREASSSAGYLTPAEKEQRRYILRYIYR